MSEPARRFRDGQKVWYRKEGQEYWNWGTVERPTGPDSVTYWVRMCGDPLRAYMVRETDMRPYT